MSQRLSFIKHVRDPRKVFDWTLVCIEWDLKPVDLTALYPFGILSSISVPPGRFRGPTDTCLQEGATSAHPANHKWTRRVCRSKGEPSTFSVVFVLSAEFHSLKMFWLHHGSLINSYGILLSPTFCYPMSCLPTPMPMPSSFQSLANSWRRHSSSLSTLCFFFSCVHYARGFLFWKELPIEFEEKNPCLCRQALLISFGRPDNPRSSWGVYGGVCY